MIPVDADAFRALFRVVPSAVGIVAVRSGDRIHATTVSSFCSLSLDPPLLMLALHQDSTILGLIQERGSFGLSVLADDQEDLAKACAEKGPGSLADEHWDVQDPHPRIAGATAWAGCEIDQVIPGGDHRIVTARVVDSKVPGRPPLIHHARAFHRLPGTIGD